MNTDNITRDDWIIGGVALLLVIDLLFLPWFDISAGPFGSFTLTATDAPSGWTGILAVLLGLALIADLAVERLAPQTTLPVAQRQPDRNAFCLGLRRRTVRVPEVRVQHPLQ